MVNTSADSSLFGCLTSIPFCGEMNASLFDVFKAFCDPAAKISVV